MIDKYNTQRLDELSFKRFHYVSQAGGGVAFKSPQIWRISHYKFSMFQLTGLYTWTGKNIMPTNEPYNRGSGRLHGMDIRFEAEKNGISVLATYFVGEYENAYGI